MRARKLHSSLVLAATILAAPPAPALEGRWLGSVNRTEGIEDGDVMRHLYELTGRRTLPRNLDFRWRFSQQYQRRLGVAESDVLRTRLFGDLRGQIWRLDAQLEPWQRNAPGPVRSRERQSQVGFRLMPPRLPQLDLRIDRLDRDTQSGLSSSESKRVHLGWSGGGVSTEAAFRRIDAVPAGVATSPSRTDEWRGGLHVVRGGRRTSMEGGYDALVSNFRSRDRRRSLDTQRVQLSAGWTPVRQISMHASFFDRWGRTEDNAQPRAQQLDEIGTAANLRVRPGAGFEVAGTHEYRRQSAALGDVVTDYLQVEGLFRRDVRRGLALQSGYLGTMRLGGASGDVPRSTVYGFLDGRLTPRIDGHAETRAARARGEGVGGTQWRHALQGRTRPTRRTKLDVGWHRETLPEILGVAQRDRQWEVQGGWEPFRGASLAAAWRRLDGDGRMRRAERQSTLTGSYRPSETMALSVNWSRRKSTAAFDERVEDETGGLVLRRASHTAREDVIGADLAFWLPARTQARASYRDATRAADGTGRSYGLTVEKRF